jgi:protein-tyrosine kinase
MERIQEALQRAREQRETSARLSPVFKSATDATTVATVGGNEIAYTQTQTVPVAQDELKEHRVVSAYDPCLFSDAYKILSTQVARTLRENRWNTVAVTSPGASEGKTLVSVNLAISLAMEFHHTALLVDADLRRPTTRDCLGLPNGPGLGDYLLDDVPLERLLIRPDIRGLVVLPGGSPQLHSSEMLGSQKMASLVRELKGRYSSRIVVFDLPPLLSGADVLAFAPSIEATVLVVEEGKTSRDDVVRATELLAGTHLIGTVLNKARRVPLRRGYGPPPAKRVAAASD